MPDHPNLVFLLTDQQAIRTLGCYGNDRIETPNVDAFARESVQFERAYCAQPVCTPNRSTLLTGRYPHTTGLTENNTPLPGEERCLPELGDFEEYATAFMGKWDLGDEIFPQHGFEKWISIDDGYRDQYTRGETDERSSYASFLEANGFEPDLNGGRFSREFAASLPEEYSKPAYLADEATRFIHEHRDEPFILFVSFLEPHPPYSGPRDEQYNSDDVSLPRNFDHAEFDDQPLRVRYFREANRRPEAEWREIAARYWGLASLVDTHAGRILDALSEEGLTEQTATVYTSDHGTMMGSQRLLNKNVLFEESVRVPLLLRVPGAEYNGSAVEHPVSQVDLVPTLLDALGEPRPDRLQGYSLLPFLRGDEDAPVEPNVVIEQNGPDGDAISRRKDEWPASGSRPEIDADVVASLPDTVTEAEILRALQEPVRSIVTPDGWKLNYHCDGGHELYDLDRDPHETENLAGRSEHAERVANLFELILDWQVRTRDRIYLP
jgi:arylsulfatase A-like enzyme